jgi:hypothetical protein
MQIRKATVDKIEDDKDGKSIGTSSPTIRPEKILCEHWTQG